MSATYDVVLLIEQALSASDAAQVHELHEGLQDSGDRVTYHVLLPVVDAAARLEAAMGSMGSMAGGDMMASPAMALDADELAEVQHEARERADQAVTESVAALQHAGADAHGSTSDDDPVDALIAKVKEVDGREVIIVTRPHLVSEFFHLDWTSRARRKLDVPVLHLLGHENIDEQSAGAGEGISGF